MTKKIISEKMGKSDLGWLRSIFHFSFADYYNPDNMNFGVLRVINDDLVNSKTGFEMHPHRDMEIISYVVDGNLTHGDSMQNKKSLSRGAVQYMSAGTGIMHSEHNLGDSTSRFLQIWIVPDKKGYTPQYGDYQFDWELRVDKWFKLVSGQNGDAPIKINQDANIYAIEITEGHTVEFKVDKDRQAYLVLIEGEAQINEHNLTTRDALESVEESLSIKANQKSHLLVIEMQKS